jgi:hypothetical protein
VSIRIRTTPEGYRVALCAVESDELPGDVYLDDADHYALAAKFAQDFGHTFSLVGRLPAYPEVWAAMARYKVRDAQAEFARWDAERRAREAESKAEECGT